MQIETRKLDDGFFEEFDSETQILMRLYAQTSASGYVSAINLTPNSVDYAEILNVDLVLTEYPPILAGRFEFDYDDPNRRLARRSGRGFGKFAHVHLSVNQTQINLLLKNFGKKIWLSGDEVAVQRGGKCMFWQTGVGVEMLDVPQDNPLHSMVREVELARRWNGETACHFINVQAISSASDEFAAAGSGMSGHFASGAAGVAGYGGSIAQNSLKKAREATKENYKNSEGGKNKEAADRLDMQNRVEKLRDQQKGGR